MPTTLAVVLVILFVPKPAPLHYTAAPIDARVVDDEAGEPISGAIVVAHWELVAGSLDGEHHRGQLEVKDAITDAEGHFRTVRRSFHVHRKGLRL